MQPLERVAVLLTLMKRLSQIMDHERVLLRGMKLQSLADLNEEKRALAEAYEIEFARLRANPEIFAALDDQTRHQVEEEMRRFQATLAASQSALGAMQTVIERLLRNITETVARERRPQTYGRVGPAAAMPRGQVISVAFDQKL